MDLFKDIKSTVTARMAAEQYGLSVDKNAMALCPFHEDHNPSLKVSRGFHCFGCGAQGDVITFTAMLFGITPGNAAKKLARDFGISNYAPVRSPPDEIQQWSIAAKETLHKYYGRLILWKQERQPADERIPWDPLFVEALQNQADIREMIRILEFGTEEEKKELYEYDREKVKTVDERMQSSNAG